METKLFGNLFLTIMVLSLVSSPVLGQTLADIAPCREGDVRPCGSGVGACEKGQTTCLGGIWGTCDGSVGPSDEICDDGLDNDCNGLIDDCGFNTVSILLIGSGCMLLVVALILNKMGK